MSADVTELLRYANQVQHVVSHAEDDLSRVVERGAQNIKRTAVQTVNAFSRGRYLKHYPRSITYEMVTPLEAEIGPDKSRKQGGMGRGVEFGSAHTPPLPHLLPAADVDLWRTEQRAAAIIARHLR